MTDGAACAHLRVSWRTETLPGGGQTRGWWECDTCAAGFTPSVVHSAEFAKVGTALGIARQDAETFRSLYEEAKVTEARLMEIPGRPIGVPGAVVDWLRARAEGAEALATRLAGLVGAARADLETMLTVAHTVTWAEGMEGRAYDEARTRRLVGEIDAALVTIGRGAE